MPPRRRATRRWRGSSPPSIGVSGASWPAAGSGSITAPTSTRSPRNMLGAAAETAEVEAVVVAALRRDPGRAVPATDAARAAASRLGSAAALRAEVDAHLAGGAGESTAVTVALRRRDGCGRGGGARRALTRLGWA